MPHRFPSLKHWLSLLPIALISSLLFAAAAHAGDPAERYEQEMEKAIAAIDKQWQADQPITLPTLQSTGSAMYDEAAKLNIQFTVGLRRETGKMGAWQRMLLQDADFVFLSEPASVEQKYRALPELRLETDRHLTAYMRTVSDLKKGIQKLHTQYGKQADVFDAPYVDKMAVQYPSALNKLVTKYEQLIEYAHLNAGKIKPAANGLVTMDTNAGTVRILKFVQDYDEAAQEFVQMAGGASNS